MKLKTNLFRFIKLKRNKIVIEEETIDSPFLLFLKRYHKYILLLVFLLALISIIASVYFAIINIRESSKIVTNINNVVVDFHGNNTINSVNLKPITGGQAIKEFYDRYGNIGLREGIIFLVKEVNFKNGKIVYYSDGSAKIVANDGTITRVSALENGDYGVKENGDIIIGVKTKFIAIEKTIVLEDGTSITYYSDHSCEIIYPGNNNTVLVRNSDRLIIKDNKLITIMPSGVSDILKTDNINGNKITYYEDGTIKLEKGNNTYIIRNNEDIDLNTLDFPNNNQAIILNNIKLKDGTEIIYYTDGSAEIKKNGESMMVRQSKDIIYTDEKIIEIIETRYAKEVNKRNTLTGKEIIYLNNGGALIKNPDGSYEYVYENSEIKYTDNGNIKDGLDTIKEKKHKVTPDGTIIIDLEDGNSIIIDDNGYRVVKTNKIVYDPDGNIKGIEGEIEKEKDDTSISESNFVVENNGKDNVKYIVTIELSDNYTDYAPVKLSPKYLRYNIVVNSLYLEDQLFEKQMKIGTELQGGTKIEKETYILYEGNLKSGSKEEVNLGIWVDYDNITNDYQDSVFVGTIKVYSETIEQ